MYNNGASSFEPANLSRRLRGVPFSVSFSPRCCTKAEFVTRRNHMTSATSRARSARTGGGGSRRSSSQSGRLSRSGSAGGSVGGTEWADGPEDEGRGGSRGGARGGARGGSRGGSRGAEPSRRGRGATNHPLPVSPMRPSSDQIPRGGGRGGRGGHGEKQQNTPPAEPPGDGLVMSVIGMIPKDDDNAEGDDDSMDDDWGRDFVTENRAAARNGTNSRRARYVP
jgi:hypothetical protein